ncbi:MAG TPA: hypothetical protein PLN48_14310 [Lachnospiraceae bacterium]|nr:hypothetical protein [Lachnospiraceae bacterium]
MAQFDGLLRGDGTVDGVLDFRDRGFATAIDKRCDIKGFTSRT